MPIAWRQPQLREVAGALKQFHADSSKCAAAARRILPVARQVDPDAHGVKISPADAAPFVLTIKGRRWDYHVAVEAVAHRVDALTGPHGHPRSSYLATFFQYPKELTESTIDVDSIDPGIQSDQ